VAFQLEPAKPLGPAIARLADDLMRAGIGGSKKTLGERIHNARTTCKKTRALLRLLRERHPRFFRKENRRLRGAANRLAKSRDAEALVSAAHALAPPSRRMRTMVGALQRQLAAHCRATLADKPVIEGQLAAFRRDLQASRAAVAHWRPSDRTFGAISGEIEASYRKARRLAKTLKDDAPGAAYHEWRKSVKVFAYHCRLLRGAWPKISKPFAREAKRLGDILGSEHDLTILCDFLAEGGIGQLGPADPTLLKAVRRERLTLRRQAHRLSERLFVENPRAYAKRLAAWWRYAAGAPDGGRSARES
jgi:CHAD domain-containing protein